MTQDASKSGPTEPPRTVADAVKELEEIAAQGWDGDVETNHIRADSILLDILRGLGHDDVVDAFTKIPRWYA